MAFVSTSGTLRTYGLHRMETFLPPNFFTTVRTRFHAAAYCSGVLPFTVPLQAYQGVFGSGMGRKITGTPAAFISLPSSRRSASNFPAAILARENLGWSGPSTPESGIQFTMMRRPRSLASLATLGSSARPVET